MPRFRQLLSYLKNYKRYVILNIISNILMGVFMVVSIPALIPFFQILFDRTPEVTAKPEFALSTIDQYATYQFSQLIANNSKETALAIVCIGFVGLFFFKNLFRYLSMFFMAYVRNGIVYDVRNQLYQKYLSLPLAYFSNERKGDLISRTTSDVQEIEFSILNVLETTFREPIVILGSIGFMLYISPRLTLFVFVLLIFTGLIIGGISRTLKKQSLKAQEMLANLVSMIEESLGGMRIIKAFNAQPLQSSKFDAQNAGYRSLLTRILWRRDLSSPLSEFLGIAVVAVLLWYGSRQVFASVLSPETFFAFLFAFYNVINPAKALSSAYYHIQKGLAAVDRINEVLNTSGHIEEKSGALPLTSFKHSIEFKNVSFRYPGTDVDVLRNVSFEIRKGQITAFVGSSGSGKSTLVDLLPRFHDATGGEILIDGVNIKNYKIDDLRSMLGVVSQDAILFNDTIENNIRFSTLDKSEQDVISAANHAHAHDFIMATEAGYQTVTGDRGVKLSGGQRQRLTIARALLKNPPILILDEATAALDSESERAVQRALDHVMQGRTALVVAHRLSTIQNADVIYVLRDGEIVEQGTHAELQSQDGEYHKFVALQAF